MNPFKNADPDVVPRLQLLVSSITIRRVKDKVLEIELPSRSDQIVRLKFSNDEQKLHDWFEADSSRKVQAVTAGDKMGGKSYARILTAITNLRLICAHGRDLLNEEALKLTDGMTYDNPMEIVDDENVDAVGLNRHQAYDMLELFRQMDNDDCAVAGCGTRLASQDNDEFEEDDAKADISGVMTTCYHMVCAKHTRSFRQELLKTTSPDGLCTCPFCDSRITPILFELKKSDYTSYMQEQERLKRDPKLAKKIGAYNGPSSKTKALLEDLAEHRAWSEANPTEAPIKRYVFTGIPYKAQTDNPPASSSPPGPHTSTSSKSPSRRTTTNTSASTAACPAKRATAPSPPSTRTPPSPSSSSPSAQAASASTSPKPTKPSSWSRSSTPLPKLKLWTACTAWDRRVP